MPSCEKCWADAFRISYGSGEPQGEAYAKLIKERKCSPEQQAGPDAKTCPKCGRKAVHEIVNSCMSCGHEVR